MAGRVSLWNDIVTHHRQLESVRAIEDFDPQNVTVAPGETKKSVVVTSRVTPVNGGDAPAGKVKVCSRAAVSFVHIKHTASQKVTNTQRGSRKSKPTEEARTRAVTSEFNVANAAMYECRVAPCPDLGGRSADDHSA